MSISAAVLQVVNSAAFRRVNEVKSIQQAVMTLGLKRIFPIVKAVALRSSMKSNTELDAVWDLASEVALACTSVCQNTGRAALADNAYMLGLFHMAGIPIMMQAFPDYPEVMNLAHTEGWDVVAETERSRYQTNYATIGALLGQTWKLPAQLIEVIYYHQDVEGLFEMGDLPAITLDLLAVLKLARRIVAEHITEFPIQSEWEQVQDAVILRLGLDEFTFDPLCDKVLSDIVQKES